MPLQKQNKNAEISFLFFLRNTHLQDSMLFVEPLCCHKIGLDCSGLCCCASNLQRMTLQKSVARGKAADNSSRPSTWLIDACNINSRIISESRTIQRATHRRRPDCLKMNVFRYACSISALLCPSARLHVMLASRCAFEMCMSFAKFISSGGGLA